ncbi:MAG: hypothetical protein ACOZIN_18195 [Myxococcota bacterium]
MSALVVFCRVLHIAATCTSLGGLFYARTVLWPSLPNLPQDEREQFLSTVIRRYALIKWSGVLIVAVTGVIQWGLVWPQVASPRLYIAYFALKMLGAAGLFSITFLLALPAERLATMRRSRGFWSGLNLACALTILVGAALMRSVPKGAP